MLPFRKYLVLVACPQPWPFRDSGSRWLIVPYLLLADFVNTGLSAFLCFVNRLVYPSYGAIQRPFGLSALHDQIASGALMWLLGSVVVVLPAVVITLQLLVSADESTPGRRDLNGRRIAAPRPYAMENKVI
jgi:cytochrome c oxidase assembly factor CtaG